MNAVADPFRRAIALRIIKKLPIGRRVALRLYNRMLMHFIPVRARRTYFGMTINCDVRDMIQGTITHFGVWEPTISLLFEELIRPGRVAIDVGANIGYYSLLMAKCVGPEGAVVAIEALPKLVQRIEDHLAVNEVTNVRIVNAAVSDRAGPQTIFEAPNTNIGMTTLRPDVGFPASATVPGRRLLDILTPDDVARASLVKVDIEGAEVPPIREILAAIEHFPKDLAIVVEADGARNAEWPALLSEFACLGFEAWLLPNSYDWLHLLDNRCDVPTLLRDAPDGLSDLLLVRPEYRPESFS